MLAGDLHDFRLPDVLRLLGDGAKSGTLHVERDGGAGRIDLEAGAVVALGVGARHLPAADDEVVDLASQLLGWETGTFRFEGTVPDGDGATDGVAVADLLQRAATRGERLHALVEAQGPRDTQVVLVPGITNDVSLSPPQWALVASLAEGRTIDALVERGGFGELTTRELIDDLVRQGLISVNADTVRSAGEEATEASTMAAQDTDPDPEPDAEDATVAPTDDDATRIDGGITQDVLARVVLGLEAR
jgi:hypothetical protein